MSRRTILIILTAIMTLGCIQSIAITQVVIPTPTLQEAQAFTPIPTLQETPAITPTTAIQTKTPTTNEIKTALEIKNLENQNKWGWINSATLISTLAVFIAGIFRFYQWSQDQKLEREKRAEDQQFEREKRAEDYRVEQAKLDEERFQAVVGGLGSERIEARIGAAIMLLTFLHEGYEKFFKQTFLLTAAHLRLRREVPDISEPLDALSQALVIVFKESFHKARDNMQQFTPESLEASGVYLDNAYLSNTDLRRIRMRSASLRRTHFWNSQLQGANFKHSNMESVILGNAHLEEADLGYTNLKHANLTEAYLHGAHLTGANLESADFSNADLTNTFPEKARSLQGTILQGVKGLTKTQLDECVSKGAIVGKELST
jgi:uncharacterized protein YjbI with pentapeptide repeats